MSDLGHGTSCKHSHDNDCYSVRSHSYGEPKIDFAWQNDWYRPCPYCDDASMSEYRYICQYCNGVYRFEQCDGCKFRDKVYYPGDCVKTLTCTKDDYGDCVKPTISFTTPPTAWTNKDVTINYSGTTSGILTYTANGTQSVTATSSSGHRIREDVTVSNIDKDKPEKPTYQIN